MSKKWNRLLLVFLLLIPVLQGCGTPAEGGLAVRELNHLNVVLVTGVDYDPEHKKFIISIQSVKPSRASKGDITPEAVYTARATGDTLMEAAKSLRAYTSGRLVWFHNKIIILGKQVLEGTRIQEVNDFFARNREIRGSSWILAAKEKAEEIITSKPGSEVMMGYELTGIINNQAEWGGTIARTLQDAINSYADPYASFITGQVSTTKPKDEKKQGDKEEGDKDKGGAEKKNKSQIMIMNSVAINAPAPGKPAKVIVLNKKETQTLRILRKFIRKEPEMLYAISLDRNKENTDNTAVQTTVRSRKEKVTIENGRPHIWIKLTLDGTLLESGTEEEIGKEEGVLKIKEAIQKRMTDDMHRLLDRMQKKEKIDIFGFSSLVHRKQKKYWHEHQNQWNEIYPQVPVDISIDWNMIRRGMISQVKVGEEK
jgi:spore germination protein KC